jgi:hypothetical protein
LVYLIGVVVVEHGCAADVDNNYLPLSLSLSLSLYLSLIVISFDKCSMSNKSKATTLN